MIPTWLLQYHEAMYQSLLAKQTQSINANPQWATIFNPLNAALGLYPNSNREAMISNFMISAYGYVSLGLLFGTSTSLFPSFNAYSIFNIGGFLQATLSRPANYYNDLVTLPSLGSAKVTADIALIQNGVNADSSALSSLAEQAHSANSAFHINSLFNAPQATGQFSKEIAREFFIERNWDAVYDNLNVGNLIL